MAPPAAVVVSGIAPAVVLPQTLLVLTGANFAETASHTLHLSGNMVKNDQPTTLDLQAQLYAVSMVRAELVVDQALFDATGEGAFQGIAWVVSSNAVGETTGQQAPAALTFKRHLTPSIRDVGSGLVHLNSAVTVLGDGFLLGSDEGEAQAELKGCFLPEGVTGPCATAGTQVLAKMPLTPKEETDRTQATFEFCPSIAGLSPGAFDGTVSVVNRHADGVELRSKALAASFQLQKTQIYRLDQQAVALGQYLDIRGAGFVGGEQGSTVISFSGTFTPTEGSPRQVAFDAVTAYQNGGWVRYVFEENVGLGTVAKLRRERGVLDGTWTPMVYWGTKSEQGLPIKLSVKVAPVKQVVWVRYGKGWQESLRRFGLLAADAQIRKRIREVMLRDYTGINVDFRDDEPKDFKLYAKIDLSGQDPNGLGLLGYDNTPGKDVDNLRLYDWIGGVNALTQQDGYPGYGGVFLESILGFSEHPPSGVFKSPIASALFDQLFDPFRPDKGSELTTAEALAAPALTSTAGCPASGGDRAAQAACAIRVLGNIIGSTSSHEFGHSLGLADPYGSPTQFHNPGDVPNRLMEAGSGRPLDERAELNGQGPAVFCDEEYLYLKKILPLDPPADPNVTRPDCY